MEKLFVPIIIIAVVAFFYYRSAGVSEVAQQNIDAANAFLAKNKLNQDVIETPSGLQYQVLTKGTGLNHPLASDRVKVHYHGTLLDGQVFDSSIERGEPISFGLNQVIAGWTEGVQLMVVGEKTRFFIPSKLGYGNRKAGKIAPGSLLIFDVELLAINE